MQATRFALASDERGVPVKRAAVLLGAVVAMTTIATRARADEWRGDVRVDGGAAYRRVIRTPVLAADFDARLGYVGGHWGVALDVGVLWGRTDFGLEVGQLRLGLFTWEGRVARW